MTTTYIEAGNLTASLADRIVTGLLLPFGEVGRTNIGKFSIDGPGIIAIPNDVTVLQANLEHDQMEPVARILTATETPSGIVATFKVGENPEGDALLAEIEEGKVTGKLKALSAEVKNVVIKAGKAVSGVLTGAAFVNTGAFPGARVMAADTVDDETIAEVDQAIEEVDTTTDAAVIETIEDEYTDENVAAAGDDGENASWTSLAGRDLEVEESTRSTKSSSKSRTHKHSSSHRHDDDDD